MVLTHPEWPHTIVPLGIQQELTQLGVWIEKDWVNIQEKTCTAEYMAHTLMELGPQKHIWLQIEDRQISRLQRKGYFSF